MKNILKYLSFSIVLICFASPLFPYASSVKVSVRNSSEQATTVIDTANVYLTADVIAEFCIEPGNPSGKYSYHLTIISPQGVPVLSKDSQVQTLPRVGSSLKASFKIYVSELPPLPGTYTFKATYTENYASGNITGTSETRILFSSRTDVNSQNLQRPDLISPVSHDNQAKEILERNPLFIWRHVNPALPVSYTIWISENKDPQFSYVYRQDSIKENQFTYPNSAQQLKVGQVYG